MESKVIHEITPLMGKDVLYIADRRKKEFTYPIHNHEVYELNFVEHAKGVRRIVGDSNEVIGEYDLVLITSPDLEHVWEQNECTSDDIREITIQFDIDISDSGIFARNPFNSMKQMMHEHHNVNDQDQFVCYALGESDDMLADHVQSYLRLINNHRDELKLLLYQSQGSSLENYIDEYTEECTHLVLEFMDEFKRKYPGFSGIRTPFTYHVHMVWMFGFISEVIKHELSAHEIKRAIEDYIQFEFTGWRALINKNSHF